MNIFKRAKKNLSQPLNEKISSRNLLYPIFSEEGNELISQTGEKSFSFEMTPHDLDQKSEHEVLDLYSSLRNTLNILDDDTWLKFYRWGSDEILLSTNDSKIAFPSLKQEKLLNSKESFFGGENISDVDFFDSYLTVNMSYWRLIHLQVPPSQAYESFLDDYSCDYVLTIEKIGYEKAKKELSQKRRGQGVTLDTTHQNHEGEASYEEANRMLQAISNEGEGFFSANVWFVVKEESLESLNASTFKLLSELKKRGAKAFVETNGLDYFFNYLLMGIAPTSKKSFKINAAYLSNLLPYSKDFLHKKGLEVFSQNNKPLFLDLFDEHSLNQNWLITGGSGEGKSFLASSLMHHLYNNENVKIGIFDLGGSLRRMAMYLGAIDLSNSFNPLQFRCPLYLKRFILSIIGNGEFTKKEKGQLFGLIEEGLEESPNSFKDLITYISKEMTGIEYYFSEYWDYFSTQDTKVPNIFYIDTDGKPEGLIAPYLIFAKELSERQEGRIVNFYDECWDVFDKCPEILKVSAKTGRKNLIGSIFLTQAIVELSEEYGNAAKAIIGNTYGKIFLRQDDLNHSVLGSFEKEKIAEVKSRKNEYSEFFFSSPDCKKIARLYVPPLIYELCNSEKLQVQKQEKFINEYKEYLSFKETIDKWVRMIHA